MSPIPSRRRETKACSSSYGGKISGIGKPRQSSVEAPALNGKRPVGAVVEATDTSLIADDICERIAKGESLVSILSGENMPHYATFMRWVAANEDIREKYARAREDQAEYLAQQIIGIADDGENDTYVDENGNKRTDYDVIARSKLRVEARKWVAAKLLPKKYGDKPENNISVSTVVHNHISEAKVKELQERREQALAR